MIPVLSCAAIFSRPPQVNDATPKSGGGGGSTAGSRMRAGGRPSWRGGGASYGGGTGGYYNSGGSGGYGAAPSPGGGYGGPPGGAYGAAGGYRSGGGSGGYGGMPQRGYGYANQGGYQVKGWHNCGAWYGGVLIACYISAELWLWHLSRSTSPRPSASKVIDERVCWVIGCA